MVYKLSSLVAAVMVGCLSGMLNPSESPRAENVAERKVAEGKVYLVIDKGVLSVLGGCDACHFGNLALWLQGWPKTDLRRLAVLDIGAELKTGVTIRVTISNYDTPRDFKTARLWSFGEASVISVT